MEHGVDAFVEKAKELEVDEERQEEIYVEVEEAVEDLYDTPEGQEYKKLLEEMSRLLADHLAQSGGSAELQQVRRILDELSGESR